MIKFLIKFPIFKRIIPSIYKKYIFVTGNFLKKKKVNGINYILDTRHLIDRNFFLLNELGNPYLIVHQYDKRWSEFENSIKKFKLQIKI